MEWGDNILDEYYRNGEVFIADLIIRNKKLLIRDKKVYNDVLDGLKIDDDFIKKNFRKPVIALVGGHIGGHDPEENVIKCIRKYFKLSGRTKKILDSSFFKTKKGSCSYCGKETQVFDHVMYVFPFVRKIDSIMPDNNKPQFCKECGFKLYCGMAYFYQKGPELRFFFDSYNYDKLNRINGLFNDLDIRDPSKFNKIRKFKAFPIYHPYDSIFVILFEFIKRLKQGGLLNEFNEVVSEVKMIFIHGSGQLYSYEVIEGNTLNRIAHFFINIIKNSIEIHQKTKNKISGKINPDELIFSGFFNYLLVDAGKFSDSSRKRDSFTKSLISGKMDFVTLNEIFMERKKKNRKLPFYYKTFVNNYMEAFGLDKSIFERINGLGYSLGAQMKGSNLENFVWDIFRARGLEQFYNSLVELQAKLRTNMDLRPINAQEKDWREARAILLNGMLNAIYGGK